MEQRPCYRLPVQTDVWLYQNESLFAKASLLNVSKGGMFIRTNVMLLPKNSELDVVIEITENGEMKRILFQVTIIHRCLDGIGVSIKKTPDFNDPSVVSLLAKITTNSHMEYEAIFVA